jgi:hypothetical protein
MVGTEDSLNIHKKTARGRQGGLPPPTFSSLAEARDFLIYTWHDRTSSYDPINPEMAEEWAMRESTVVERRGETLSIFERYNAAFESFIATQGPSLSKAESQGVKVMQIHHFTAFVILNSQKTLVDVQMTWDPFIPVFEKIVNLAEEIISSDSSDPAQPVFSTDIGIIGPLYGVVSRCRDPVIRRRAIDIMKAAPRQEGIWNSILVARVAERVVEIEEQGLGLVTCCADVPDWARLSDVQPNFDAEHRRAVLSYSRRPSANAVVRSTYIEEIVW